MTAFKIFLALFFTLAFHCEAQQSPILKGCFAENGKYDEACAEKILDTLERIAVRKAFENAIPFYDEVTIEFTAYAGDTIQINKSHTLHSEKLKKAAVLYLNQMVNSIQFPQNGSVTYHWKFSSSNYIEPFRAMELQSHQRIAPLSFSKNDRGQLFALQDNLPLQYRLVNYRIYHILKENGINEIFSGSINFNKGKPAYLDIEIGFLTKSYTDLVSNILANSFEALQDEYFGESENFSLPFTYDPFDSNLNRWIYMLKFHEANEGLIKQFIALLALHEHNTENRRRCVDSLSAMHDLDLKNSFRLFNEETTLKEIKRLPSSSEFLTSDHAMFSEMKHPLNLLLTDYPPIWPGCEELEGHQQKLNNCLLQMIRAHFTSSLEFQKVMSTFHEGEKAYLSLLFAKDGSVEFYKIFRKSGETGEALNSFVEQRIKEMPKVIPARFKNDFVKTGLTVPLW